MRSKKVEEVDGGEEGKRSGGGQREWMRSKEGRGSKEGRRSN